MEVTSYTYFRGAESDRLSSSAPCAMDPYFRQASYDHSVSVPYATRQPQLGAVSNEMQLRKNFSRNQSTNDAIRSRLDVASSIYRLQERHNRPSVVFYAAYYIPGKAWFPYDRFDRPDRPPKVVTIGTILVVRGVSIWSQGSFDRQSRRDHSQLSLINWSLAPTVLRNYLRIYQRYFRIAPIVWDSFH